MSTLSNLALNETSASQTEQTSSDILSVPEACRFLSVHRNTLYKLIRAGELPGFRLITGGHWKFRKSDLAEWLETRKARSGS
jgi:excisionase family DNA binding protein